VVTEAMPVESQTLQWGVQKLIRLAQDGEVDQLWGAIQALAPECRRLPFGPGDTVQEPKPPRIPAAAPGEIVLDRVG